MAHHPLRKIFQKTGFDFHKYRPESDRLGWPKAIGVKTVLDVGANTGQFAKEIRGDLARRTDIRLRTPG